MTSGVGTLIWSSQAGSTFSRATPGRSVVGSRRRARWSSASADGYQAGIEPSSNDGRRCCSQAEGDPLPAVLEPPCELRLVDVPLPIRFIGAPQGLEGFVEFGEWDPEQVPEVSWRVCLASGSRAATPGSTQPEGATAHRAPANGAQMGRRPRNPQAP